MCLEVVFNADIRCFITISMEQIHSRPHREEDANASSFVYLNNYQNKNHPLKVAFTLFITDESKCF